MSKYGKQIILESLVKIDFFFCASDTLVQLR